jgi:hypothetical protein
LNGEGLKELQDKVIAHFEENKVLMPEQVHTLYLKYGQLGTNVTAPEQPNESGTNDTAPEQPNESGTNDTAPEQPNESGTNDTAPEQPNESGTNDTAPEQPRKRLMKSPLMYAKYDEVFSFFQSKYPGASKVDFDNCLLNAIGIVVWFAEEKLFAFVFNHIGSLIGMLKKLFVHDVDMLSFEQVHGLLPGSSTMMTQHQLNVNKLTQEGILTMPLLEVFAASCEVKADFLATLLDHLQMAYYHPENQWLLFPWYLNKVIPADIDINNYKGLSNDKLMLVICIDGYLPCVFFNRFILGIYAHLEPHRADVLRHIWDRHLRCEIDDIMLYLEQDKSGDMDRITLYLSAPLKVAPIQSSVEPTQ